MKETIFPNSPLQFQASLLWSCKHCFSNLRISPCSGKTSRWQYFPITFIYAGLYWGHISICFYLNCPWCFSSKKKCKILHILLLDFTNLSHALKCEDNLRIILSLTPLSGGSDGKESACNAGDSGLIPGLGRSPGEGKGNPLQYSCLKNSMDRGAWRVTVHGVSKSWIWLSD